MLHIVIYWRDLILIKLYFLVINLQNDSYDMCVCVYSILNEYYYQCIVKLFNCVHDIESVIQSRIWISLHPKAHKKNQLKFIS